MKKLLIISVFFLLSLNDLFSQSTHMITFGVNKFKNTLYDYTRSYGASLGYEYERDIAEGIYVKAGLTANMAMEKMIKIYTTAQASDTTFQNPDIPYIIKNRWMDKSDGLSLGLQLPVNIKVKLFHSKLFMTGGIMLSMDNLWVNSKIYSLDPSSSNSRGVIGELNKDWPKTSLLGFGHQVGLIYDVSKRFEVYAEYKTSANKEFTFSYFELGIKYKIKSAP